MGSKVVGAGVIEVAAEPHISMSKEDHVRCSAGDQEVRAYVKLLSLQEQRILNVTVDNIEGIIFSTESLAIQFL